MSTFFTTTDDIVAMIDQIIDHAYQTHSSDIHFEPYHDYCRIRLRHNGLLNETAVVPLALLSRLITRLKVMSQLDISEQRLPQDGRCQYLLKNNHTIDMRISTCPTLFGEKIVLRLLNFHHKILLLESLGLSTTQYQQVLQAIQAPQGCILVTGPTGSGKTMTLYSILQFLNQISRNIVTLEDPIEIYLPGINQTAIHHKLQLSFAHMLRSLLRQDPDVIMIGEIRDVETADVALQAAETGHLVLATLHANNTLHAIDRLAHLGIPRYKIANNISLLIAQRLLRTENNHQESLGRVAVFECLTLCPEFEPLILQQKNENIKSRARAQGFKTLCETARDKAQQYGISETEIHRVISIL